MPNHPSTRSGGDPEQGVEAADDLVRRTVLLLCKGRPPGSGRPRATPRPGIRPGVRGALGALGGIERGGPLTEGEPARRRAFAMLLQGAD